MKTSFITTEHLDLCPMGLWMLQTQYVQWLNDPVVQQFNSHGRMPYTLAQAQSWLESMQNHPNHLSLAIVHRKDQVHIGNISLQNIDSLNQSAEFAIMMGEKEYWGHGFALEASHALISHGFKQLNLNRIECATSMDNIPMQKLAIKLGMSQEGQRKSALFKNGRFVDIIEFGLLRNSFS